MRVDVGDWARGLMLVGVGVVMWLSRVGMLRVWAVLLCGSGETVTLWVILGYNRVGGVVLLWVWFVFVCGSRYVVSLWFCWS